jgi:hypothetical protein
LLPTGLSMLALPAAELIRYVCCSAFIDFSIPSVFSDLSASVHQWPQPYSGNHLHPGFVCAMIDPGKWSLIPWTRKETPFTFYETWPWGY